MRGNSIFKGSLLSKVRQVARACGGMVELLTSKQKYDPDVLCRGYAMGCSSRGVRQHAIPVGSSHSQPPAYLNPRLATYQM